MKLRLRVIPVAFFVVLLSAPVCFVQAAAQTPTFAPTQQRPTSEPYTGDLSIFKTPGRAQRLQINRVMDTLGIKPGKTVADLGAGSGWFTVHAANRVADNGIVYAVDIKPEATRYIRDRGQKEHAKT